MPLGEAIVVDNGDASTSPNRKQGDSSTRSGGIRISHHHGRSVRAKYDAEHVTLSQNGYGLVVVVVVVVIIVAVVVIVVVVAVVVVVVVSLPGSGLEAKVGALNA